MPTTVIQLGDLGCCCDDGTGPPGGLVCSDGCSSPIRMPGLSLNFKWTSLGCSCSWPAANLCSYVFACTPLDPAPCAEAGNRYHAPLENGHTYSLGRVHLDGDPCATGLLYRFGTMTLCDVASYYGVDCDLDCDGLSSNPLAARYSYVGSCSPGVCTDYNDGCTITTTIDAWLGIQATVEVVPCDPVDGRCRLAITYRLYWIYFLHYARSGVDNSSNPCVDDGGVFIVEGGYWATAGEGTASPCDYTGDPEGGSCGETIVYTDCGSGLSTTDTGTLCDCGTDGHDWTLFIYSGGGGLVL